MNNFSEGLALILDPSIIILLIVGVLIGLLIGALPGLTDPMALGLAIPFTFAMEPIAAILLLLAIHFGAIYGGSITAILINTPGTPAAAAASIDGYPLTLKGQSRKALQMASFGALVGGFISAISLMIFAPILAKFALEFGPQEYFALGIFGLSVVAGVAGKSLIKALIAATLGIFVSTIGADPLFGAERFTFGNYFLYDGIDLVTSLIGLYALSEILNQFYFKKKNNLSNHDINKLKLTGEGLTFSEIRKSFKSIVKGGFIGVIVGALPGTGAPISAFMSYGEAVRSSKKPERFGKGELEGVGAAEAGSVGTESSAMIPLLTLGIPGDVAMAILLGSFMLHGISFGPDLFIKSGDIIYAIYIGIMILLVLVFVFSWFGSGIIAKLVLIPPYFMYPIIIVLIVTGTFTLMNDIFNVWIAILFGIIGFFMIKMEYPVAPLLLGIILGPIIEHNFLLSMSATNGDLLSIITRPLSGSILLIALVSMILTIRAQRSIQKRLSGNISG